MRRSKLAQAFLSANPDTGLQYVHTLLELANFSASRVGKVCPFHAIGMTERTGDSKRTVGHYATLAEAIDAIRAETLADNGQDTGRGGADTLRSDLVTYYVRDIRTGKIYKA